MYGSLEKVVDTNTKGELRNKTRDFCDLYNDANY